MIRNPSPFPISIFACATLAFAQMGCEGGAASGPPPAPETLGDPLTWDAQKPGLYQCGHRILEVTYTPPSLPSRTIPVHVWYPSTSTDGEPTKYHAVFEDTLAHDDVPLAPTSWKDGLPVLVHSHGHMGFAGNSARIMCHFASHGWLAVAPEHIGNTISDTPATRPLDTYLQRPADITAALDLVANLPADDELSGKADLGHVAMSGHSYGSFTTWATGGATIDPAYFEMRCQSGDLADCTPEKLQALAGDVSDPRPQVIMPLAGAPVGDFGETGYDAVGIPVLMMSGSLNPVGDDQIMAKATKVDLSWVDIDGGCHQLFGSGNTLLGDPECAVLPDEEGFQLVNPWVLAFARYHVLGDRSAFVAGLVEGKTTYSPKVHLQHEGP